MKLNRGTPVEQSRVTIGKRNWIHRLHSDVFSEASIGFLGNACFPQVFYRWKTLAIEMIVKVLQF